MTSWILILVLAHIIVNLLPLWISPDSFPDSTLQQAQTTLQLYTDDDSWGPMKEAVDYFYAASGPETPRIYRHMFFEKSVKFQYPPTSLLISAAVRAVHLDGDRTIFADISFGLLILAAICTFLIVESRSHPERVSPEASVLARSVRLASILFLAFTFRPFVGAFAVGQIQVWLNSLFALAVLLWIARRYWAVGAIIGLMCCVKPQYAFVLLWALAAGRWSLAIAGTATVVAILAVSVAIFGLHNHLDYLDVIAAISRTGESFHSNQSVNGLLTRVLSVEYPDEFNKMIWRGDHFPPYTPWVYITVLVTSAVLLGISLANGFISRNGDQVRSFCAAGLSCTMASPVAWGHHYGILFAVYFLMLADLRRALPWAISIVFLYLIVANRVMIVDQTAGSYWNFLQSLVFFAGLGTLAMLYLAPRASPH